jgi:SAM-dependent methyltransferase
MPSIEWNRSEWPAQFYAHDPNQGLYGYQWGDPNGREILVQVRDRFIRPYVNAGHTALEIGPGGGRWTQFLTPFKRLYLVDLNECFFASLRERYAGENVVCVKTNGSNLPTIEDSSLDFIFSFGTFVHIDPADIEDYLESIRKKLAAAGVAVLHYADKTKPLGLKEAVFSYNTPDLMRSLVEHHGFAIMEEDLTTLPHSSMIRFAHRPRGRE